MGLLFVVLGLVVFGLVMVYSSSYIYSQEKWGDGFALLKKQLLFVALGGVALVAASHIPYHWWRKISVGVLAAAGLSLAAVLVPGIGARVGGAQRWLRVGGVQFQPGEFAKLASVIYLAALLERKQERLHTLTAGVMSPFLALVPIFLLLLLQPDFGSTVIIASVCLGLLFLAGVRLRYILSAVLLAAGAGTALALSSSYRRDRVMTFLDPWRDPAGKGFQVLQSLVGFFEGGIWGVGLGNGKEKLFFLPEAHNDFIFAVIGEELGFFGVAALVVAFLYFGYRGFQVGWQRLRDSQDRFGYFLASGITLTLLLQAFVNAAVALGLVPTKGLNLPFVSYGGSALVIDLFMVGIVLSVSRRR